MFYEIEIAKPEPGQKQVSALVVLNPSESRRLLARATVALPEVQNAYKKGMIIIARGITNAYVSEELFGISVEPKAGQTAGMVCGGITNANSGRSPCHWHVIKQGKVAEGADPNAEILNFGPDDVFIKGANAVDEEGNAGILTSSAKGGTIGIAWPIVTPRSSNLIIPVGLEKLVPSVMEAAKHSGIYHFKYSMGLPAKLSPVPLGKVVTEIQALALLTGVKAYHLASGGVGGSEGAVVLALEGDEKTVEKAFELVKSIKGEPPVTLPDTLYVNSAADYNYDPSAQLATLGGI
ncbi:hypothetical protein ACFLXG_01380 [Chloroflexota bacterium]